MSALPQFFASPPFRVAVTAAGVISPLGAGLSENLAALREGRDGIGPEAGFDVSSCRCKTAGRVGALPSHDRHERRWHPASRMLLSATREVFSGDPHFIPELMVVGTTSGGMSFGEAFFRAQTAHSRPRSRAAWLANYSPQKALLDTQRACGFSIPSQIVANACASGSNAIGHAFSLIRAGLQKTVLCGGYDVLSQLVFVGFDSLQALTPDIIRPFDKNRSGLVLGEGAAMLALEELESARKRGAPILAEIGGYGLSTDNHHLTQPHPSGIGPLQAMRRALESAHCRPSDIDYINAHGTATAFNDATEGAAIAQLFGQNAVPVSSTKSLMGHALGAAGAIEAVFSILALQHDFLPPNAHYQEADPQWDLDIVANVARPKPLRRVLSNSFGFGGVNASLVFEKTRELL